MTYSDSDSALMARALRLAELGVYTTTPNPRVGCVLAREGEVIAEGWHRKAGKGHAEVNALAAAGELARGATAYVTLEPCSHTGKTGPCCEALISAGVSRVVYGMEDPNPTVAGRGLERLRAAGVEVDGPVLEASAWALNPGFIKRMEKGLPYVRCKLAMSLDGRTAMASGESKWVTARRAREDVQRQRARSCALISGIESVLSDDSSLTVREDELVLPEHLLQQGVTAAVVAESQPLRVILDSRLRLPRTGALLQNPGPVLLVHADADVAATVAADGPWPEQVELVSLPAADGRIDLLKLLQLLGRRQCNEVLVESGAVLAGSFLRRGLLDELVVYMAPKLLGSKARPLFDLPLDTMAGQLPLTITDITAVGSDWRITARPDPEG